MKKITPCILALALSFLYGCETPPMSQSQFVQATNTVASLVAGDMTLADGDIFVMPDSKARTDAVGVVCGLTAVDPSSYGGWTGECPGTDVDATTFSLMCRSKSVSHYLLMNERATIQNVIAKARLACEKLKDGGLLILYFSGHGGQVPSVEEPDGFDETMCLWDGNLIDDVVWRLLVQVPDNVRVWMITDSCNSGTNYRKPHSYAKALFGREPNMLHWSGCADGLSSFGGKSGGVFTTALVDSWADGQSYDAWFKAAKKAMPTWKQMPTVEETGKSFKHMEAFK